MNIQNCLKPSAEAEAEASEVDSFIAQAEVTAVIQKLLGGQVQRGAEVLPEYLKSLGCLG